MLRAACRLYGPSVSAMGWMEGSTEPPKWNDTTPMAGAGKLGRFWLDCKRERKCGRPPYDRLLDNPVLRADYHAPHTQHERYISRMPYMG